MLAELRGWGAIQNLPDLKAEEHGEYQDTIGDWIAEAINEKRERDLQQEKQKNCK